MSLLSILLTVLFSRTAVCESGEQSLTTHSNSVYQALKYKYKARYNANTAIKQAQATKQTICITTRDGICLSTNVYTPSAVHKPPYDVLYAKTPYGKNSLDADAAVAEPLGWIFLGQDVRGRGQSSGAYSFWRTSGNDSLDTMQWVLAQNWTTGNLAAIGVSANALAQYSDLTGVTQFPVNTANFNKYNAIFQHLRIAQLFLGDGMGWHTVYQGGAYRTGLISGWLTGLHEVDMIQTVQENEVFNEWWYPLAGPYHMFNEDLAQWSYINQTVIHFAGFYDIFSTPQIKTALAVNATAQIDAQGKQILIIDPGGHCPMGEIVWPHDAYGFELIEVWTIPATEAAFNAGTNGNMADYDIHKYFPFNALWYQLGPGPVGNSTGNFWVEAESFGPSADQLWYLQSGGGLSTSQQTRVDQQSYIYNPKNPVGTYGGNNLILQPCGPWNQDSVEKGRSDILHFSSAVLEADIALVGELRLNLFVSSDAPDTDFTAKLIDIHPNGNPYLVQDGILRMRWRETGTWTPSIYQTKPSDAMIQGTVYNVTIDLAFMSFIFNKGHRISVSVSSSNYKRFSLNFNTGNMVIDDDKNWRNATNTIHFGGRYPSAFVLPVVDLQWLNEHRVPMEKINYVHQTVSDYYANKNR